MDFRNGINISICVLFCLLLSFAVKAEDEKSQIIVNPPSLKFYAVIGSPESKPQNVSIYSQNGQSLHFQCSNKWISFKVSDEFKPGGSGKLEVSVNAKDLEVGVYEGDILITDTKNNISNRVPVTLIIASNDYARSCHD